MYIAEFAQYDAHSASIGCASTCHYVSYWAFVSSPEVLSYQNLWSWVLWNCTANEWGLPFFSTHSYPAWLAIIK